MEVVSMFGFRRKRPDGLKLMVQVPVNIANKLGGIIKAVEITENAHGIKFEQIEVKIV
jgi:hypothetical protein